MNEAPQPRRATVYSAASIEVFFNGQRVSDFDSGTVELYGASVEALNEHVRNRAQRRADARTARRRGATVAR